jgi:hypothetical protein
MRLSRARERLTDPVMTRLPRRTTDDSTQALDAAHKDMQEARAALSRDEYSRSLELANAASARIAQVEITIEKLAGPAPPRKRR